MSALTGFQSPASMLAVSIPYTKDTHQMNDTIRKLVIPVAAIAAMGYGGAQLAGASGKSGSGTPSTPAAATTPAGDGDGETADDAQPAGDAADRAEQVTGTDADKAKAAALTAVPGGTVGEIHRERQDEAGQHADTPDQGGTADAPEHGDTPDGGSATDTPEAGDTPDPSYERKIAYDVQVKKADGSAVTVHLDQAFAVLGTTAEQPDHGSDD